MTFQFSTIRTRRLKPSHEPWNPHAYQIRATEFLLDNGAAALFADPGTGKTSIVLNAVTQLKEEGLAGKTLVIAPKRVCEGVWWQESRKWSQFRHLEFAWLHDSRAPWAQDASPKKKDAELKRDADIYLINTEGVPWLCKKYYGRALPFDTVVIDELTRFKNSRAQRSKALRKATTKTKRMWGLTGTPTPNGYGDLFGQMLLLDGGNALDEYYTHFRDKYFVQDGFTGFDYKLAPGADKRIEARIAPLVLRMSAEDYLDLPELVDDIRTIKLDHKARGVYEKMKKEMLLAFSDGDVTAANAAALYSKLSQMANGAVYLDENPHMVEKRGVAHVHDAKLDALEELVDELAGQPLLVAYEFRHDLERLRARFGADTPYIGAGAKNLGDIQDRWNAGQIPLLFAHPASAGHGLNLQGGGARHICWFSTSWDYELYDQLIKRIYRQGNESEHIINHLLVVEDTIDALKIEALRDKETTQDRLLAALNTEILHDAGDPAAGKSAAALNEESADMAVTFKKLSRKPEAGAESDEEETTSKARKFTPKGWPSPATANDDADDDEAGDEEAQKVAIRDRLSGKGRAAPPPDEEEDEELAPPTSAFSKALLALVGEEPEEAEEPEEPEAAEKAPKKARAKRSSPQKTAETPGPVATNKAAGHLTPTQIEAIATATAAAVTAAIEKILSA